MAMQYSIENPVYDDKVSYLKMNNNWLVEDLEIANEEITALKAEIALLKQQLRMKKVN